MAILYESCRIEKGFGCNAESVVHVSFQEELLGGAVGQIDEDIFPTQSYKKPMKLQMPSYVVMWAVVLILYLS